MRDASTVLRPCSAPRHTRAAHGHTRASTGPCSVQRHDGVHRARMAARAPVRSRVALVAGPAETYHASCARHHASSCIMRAGEASQRRAPHGTGTPLRRPEHASAHAGATHPYCSKLSGKRTPRSVESIVNMNRGALAVACGARTPGNRHRGQLAGWLPSRRCLLPRAAANSRLGRDRERSAPRAQRAGAGLLRMPRSNTRPGAKRHSRRLSGHKAQLTHMY